MSIELMNTILTQMKQDQARMQTLERLLPKASGDLKLEMMEEILTLADRVSAVEAVLKLKQPS